MCVATDDPGLSLFEAWAQFEPPQTRQSAAMLPFRKGRVRVVAEGWCFPRAELDRGPWLKDFLNCEKAKIKKTPRNPMLSAVRGKVEKDYGDSDPNETDQDVEILDAHQFRVHGV